MLGLVRPVLTPADVGGQGRETLDLVQPVLTLAGDEGQSREATGLVRRVGALVEFRGPVGDAVNPVTPFAGPLASGEQLQVCAEEQGRKRTGL